jgi:uncharacterized protein YebE (UPF0316 family)
MDELINQLVKSIQPDVVTWVIFPLAIFLARVMDVSLGTMRIIFTARGKYLVAPLLGFVEVFIWIVAVSQLVRNIHNLVSYLAYAAGFAAGTFIGLQIERRLAIGKLMLHIIVQSGGEELAFKLHESNYGVTTLDAQGSAGAVKLIYTIINRRDLKDVESIIHEVNPKAFISVEEVSETQAGIFPVRPSILHNAFFIRKSSSK